jgi:hypothetical protein
LIIAVLSKRAARFPLFDALSFDYGINKTAKHVVRQDDENRMIGLSDRPKQALALVCGLQIALWTIGPALVSNAPPLDVVEGYLWGREWPLVTYKHPQLPGWVLETAHRLTGSFVWPHYFVSQLFVCATFLLVYGFGREIMGRRAALAGALLMPALYYCEWVSPQFNHDTAQLPFWAAIVWLLWRAMERNTIRAWLFLGLVAGIGLYAKFSTGVIIGFGGLFLLIDAKARSRLATPMPWIGLAVFALVASPIAASLIASDFLPFRYAEERTEWVTTNRNLFYFVWVQLAAHAGLLIAVLATGLVPLPWLRKREPDVSPTFEPPQIATRARNYLVLMAIGPGLLIAVASLFTGVGEAWATPMFNLSGLLAVAIFRRHLTEAVLRRITIAAPIFVAVWSMAYCSNVALNEHRGKRLSPVLYPRAEMSARMDTIWQKATGLPLKIVGGETQAAMVAALSIPGEPSYFTDFNFTYAPWITPERIAKEGMLVLWQGKADNPPAAARSWLAHATVGTESFVWSPAAAPFSLSYAIVPPTP